MHPREDSPGSQIKVFSHNVTNGEYFSSQSDALNKNPTNPNAALFSILDTLETYRRADGKFRFKLCYPELTWGWEGGKCNEWLQTSNPVSETEITGFERISGNLIAFGSRFDSGEFAGWVGIGRSHSQFSNSLIDDDPTGDNWFTAIGALKADDSALSNTLPGPVSQPYVSTISNVKVIELYVLTEPTTTTTTATTAAPSRLRFSAKSGGGDIHVLLSECNGCDGYEIVIGGGPVHTQIGNVSVIRDSKQTPFPGYSKTQV